MIDRMHRRTSGGFAAMAWEREYRASVDRAFRQVPFYREQWAAAGRVLEEPETVSSESLGDQLYRLCPLSRPFNPAREPSLWHGDVETLRAALALGGVGSRVPVLEVRPAALDRRTLSPGGQRYGVLLPPDARVIDEERRHALNAKARRLAADSDRAVVIGTRSELDAVLPELGSAAVTAIVRGSLADMLSPDGDVTVAHDRHLGYFAVRDPTCHRVHLLWRDFHASTARNGLAVSALRRRRPTLINVVPAGADGADLSGCHVHATPVIVRADVR